MHFNEQTSLINEGIVLAEDRRYAKYINSAKRVIREKTGRDMAPHMVSTVAMALNETHNWLSRMDETTRSTNAGTFVDYGFKLVTAILPNLVADRIVSIQPLKMKSGEIFYMNFKYGQTKGRILSGATAIGANTGFQPGGFNYSTEVIEEESVGTGDASTTAFSGNLAYYPVRAGSVSVTTGSVTASDNGSGTLSGSGIASGTINYTNGAWAVTFSTAPGSAVAVTASYEFDSEQTPTGIGQVDIDLTQATVTARPYKLRALYTLDAAWDLQQAHGKDADAELVAALAGIIRAEIDEGIMKDLWVQAAAGTTQFDATVPSGVSKQEHYDGFIHKINQSSNQIYTSTRMVAGNFIIAGINAASIIEGMGKFESAGMDANGSFSGPYVCGTLDNRFTVIKNPSYGANDYVVGHKGQGYLYAGYVWAPYRPLYTTNPVVLDDMIVRRGLYTSGGKKMVNSKMFAKGTIINYT